MPTHDSELNDLASQGLRRELVIPTGIDFSSNDFFGLSRAKSVRNALIQYLENETSMGSTGSRLVSGHSRLVQETEEYLAQLFGRPTALFFGCGYLANLGILQALSSQACEFFSDQFNHASLIDGMRLTKSKTSIFNHNDLDNLRLLLARSPAKRKIVVTESVFSMDGKGPDIEQLRDLVNEFDAFLVLDEAHATGVCGSSGLGRAYGICFDSQRTIFVHTCGKALGGHGAFILASASIRDLVINKARSLIYSTALSPLHIVQTKFALIELQADPSYRETLMRNIDLMNFHLKRLGTQSARSHIISIPIPGNERAVKVAQSLQDCGYFVRAIRSPTVPLGTERLRVTIKSFHDPRLYSEFADHLAGILT